MTTITDSTLVEAGVTAENQAILERAAAIRGQSLIDFVVSVSLVGARKAILQNDQIALTLADQERFAAALLNPLPPTEALQRAIDSHRQLIQP